MANNLIRVLWVEDDPNVIRSYPIEAEQYGIELKPFDCWEEAEKHLCDDFDSWSAIILDAKCKFKKGDHDNASRFLSNVFSKIAKICTKHNWIIPWYVLSGGSEEDLNDLIIEEREKWDGDWPKKYYSKATDREMLFRRICYHAKISPKIQIRNIHYSDVFEAIEIIGLDCDDSFSCLMEELLFPIHFDYLLKKDYNAKMSLVRICIENIFSSMAQHGLLPYQEQGDKIVIHDILKGIGGGGINITWCSKIIAGKDIKSKSDAETIIKSKKTIIPNVLKESFQRLIQIAHASVHAPDENVPEEQQKNSRDTRKFLEIVNDAPYLLRGMTMELCNIILWYADYLDKHKDITANAQNWEVFEAEKSK